jgi:hypothetical protein
MQYGVDPAQAYAPAAVYPVAPVGKKSVLPLLAIIFAGVAFLFAVIPPTSGIAWAFAITAIVLAIVALVKKTQQKGLAIAALIVAPLAWFISVIVFIVSVAAGLGGISTSRDAPRTPVEQSSEQPTAGEPAEEPVEEAPVADGSSLTTPLPAGTTVSVDSWSGKFDVSFGAINWDATSIIEAENRFNSDPSAGKKYIMVAVTMTSTDTEEWSPYGTFFWSDIKLVSNGQGFSEGTIVVVPNGLSDQGDLYPGGTATGNVVFEVPADLTSGVWDVDGVYVSAQ